MVAAFAVGGVWTSVGLFRLRPWARMSILIFAGFLAAWSLFMVLVMSVVPIPPDTSAVTASTVRRVTMIGFSVPLAIGVWWLIQFNTRSTKAAFASQMIDSASGMPLSISIIGWMQLVAGALCVIPLLAGMPAFAAGMLVTGWPARLLYLVLGAFLAWVGRGLLDLREKARVAAITWFVISFVHSVLVVYVPSWWQRLLEMQQTMSGTSERITWDQGMLPTVMVGAGALVTGVAIWFLVQNRSAFVRSESH